MASDVMEPIICWNGCGCNSWQSRRDMDCDGAQANENGHKLFYRFVSERKFFDKLSPSFNVYVNFF